MKPLILPALGSIASQLFFYMDDFGIKLPSKVDMSLNKWNFFFRIVTLTFLVKKFKLQQIHIFGYRYL